ncbi:MAG: 3-keto-5-aminohexanoate cleavage protein [Cohaesibacter sp.]|nr:3-keto-5-aminohexanoate cleavage protein [Cohaesibacter sp.]
MILGIPRPALLAISASNPNSTKVHHPAIPLSLQESVACARQCQAAGGSLYHLIIRDEDAKPTLQSERVKEVFAHIEQACNANLPIQLDLHVPSGDQGAKGLKAQREAIEAAQPKAITIAFRDLFPQGADEDRELQAREFLDDCKTENVAVQFSFTHCADLDWFYAYRQYGLISVEKPMLLLDLTISTKSLEPTAHALRPFLAKLDQLKLLSSIHWSVAAPANAQLPTAAAALALGGHCQIGLAHNLHDENGELSQNSAAQLAPIKQMADILGRPAANAFETMALLRG